MSQLDHILVSTTCPTCNAHITASYAQIRTIGMFACGCGSTVGANMHSVAPQALIQLADNESAEPVPVSVSAAVTGGPGPTTNIEVGAADDLG